MTGPTLTDEPYPGLRSFRRDETHIFFGRETCINDMVQRLAVHRFLAVTGTSGSGKSSLVRTGLLDALDRGLLATAGADWRFADFRPGDNPLSALAAALVTAIGLPASEQDRLRVEAMLARGPLGLVEWIESTDLSPDTSLLVLADQFEEIFRFRRGRTGDDINAFVALLLASAGQRKRPIYVIITMRSDFLGECAQFTGLAEAINDGQYLTPRLTREQCRSAIEGPAAVFGGRVESALTNRLLNDMGTNADQLPLAQHALMRLWHISSARKGPDAGVLKLEDYEKLGGIGSAAVADGAPADGQVNALSAHADEILAGLTTDQQHLTAILFRALTESHGAGGRDVRRPIALGEAAAVAAVAPEQLVPVIDAFRAPGRNLLTPPINVPLNPQTVVDISHESLIRQWGTLREWLREEADAARIYLHVEANAELWREGNSGLMTMPYLGIARAWRERERPNASWAKRYGDDFDLAMEFLDRSFAAEQQRIEAEEAARRRSTWRTRAVAIAMTVLAVIAGGFAYYGFQAANKAQKSAEEASRAEALANQMSNQALKDRDSAQRGQSNYLAELARERFRDGELLYSLLYSVEALPDQKHNVSRPEIREAREMLMQSYLQLVTQKAPLTHATEVNALKFLPSGDRVLTASDDGTARIWDLNGWPAAVLNGHLGPVSGVDVTTDGKLIATASVDGIARIWDGGSGRMLAQFPGTIRLRAVSIRNDDKAIVAAGADGVARLWDIATARQIGELKSQSSAIRSAQFNPDGSQVLIVTDKSAQVWDVQNAKLIKEISFGFENISRASYVANGARIALLGMYGTAEIWDAKALKPIASFKRDCCNSNFAVSPDGSLLAIVGGMNDVADIYDVRTLKKIWSTSIQHVQDLVFSPNGSQLITYTWSNDTFTIWDARNGDRIFSIKTAQRVNSFVLSPDGKHIAALTDERNLTFLTVTEKSLSDNSPSNKGGSVILSGNGRQFLFAQDGGSMTVWDVSAQKMLGTLLSSRSTPLGAFDPKGQWIAAVSADNGIGIWQSDTLRHAADIPNVAPSSVAFGPDGRVLAASATANQFDVFDDNAEVRSSQATEALGGVKFAIPSPDGHELFMAGSGTVGQVWNIDTGHLVATIFEPGTFSDGAIFTPDGTRLVTQSESGTARLLDARTGAQLALLQTDGAGFRFNASGDRMITKSQTGEARIWDLSSGKMLLQVSDAGTSLMMSAYGDTAIFWSDQQLKVLDTRHAREIGNIKLEASSFPQVSADGSRIVIEHGATVAIWDAQTLQQISTLAGTWHDVQDISVFPNRDASRIVVKDDNGAAQLFDGASGKKMTTLDDQFQNGVIVITRDGARSVLARHDGRVDLWDIAAGKRLAGIEPGGAGFRLGVDFSDDSNLLVTTTAGPMARVWNARTGEHIADLTGHAAEIVRVAVSPGSKRIVTSSKDGVALVWDAHTDTKIAGFTSPQSIRSILFSADGTHIVSVDSRSRTDLFAAGTWKAMGGLAGQSPNLANAFSPDGQYLITTLGTDAKVWEISSGRDVAILHGHTATIGDAAFSPDGTLILTVSEDKTGRIWNAKTGAVLAVLKGDANPIKKGQFALNGKYVVTISGTGEAKLWRTADGSLVSDLGSGKNHTTAVPEPNGKTIALFTDHDMTEYALDGRQPGETVTNSISLLEGKQSGIDYVNAPFAKLVTSTDRTLMNSGKVLWLMPWSTQDYVEQVHAMLPRCLTRDERRKAYLDPQPPVWCIEMGKWPYNSPAWKQWLADKEAGQDTPMPERQ